MRSQYQTMLLLTIAFIALLSVCAYILNKKRDENYFSYQTLKKEKRHFSDANFHRKQIRQLAEQIRTEKKINMCDLKDKIQGYFNSESIINEYFMEFNEEGNLIYPDTTTDITLLCESLSNFSLNNAQSKNLKSSEQALSLLILIADRVVNIPVPNTNAATIKSGRYSLYRSIAIIHNALSLFNNKVAAIKKVHSLSPGLTKAAIIADRINTLIKQQGAQYSKRYKYNRGSEIITDEMANAMLQRVAALKPGVSQLYELTSPHLLHCN